MSPRTPVSASRGQAWGSQRAWVDGRLRGRRRRQRRRPRHVRAGAACLAAPTLPKLPRPMTRFSWMASHSTCHCCTAGDSPATSAPALALAPVLPGRPAAEEPAAPDPLGREEAVRRDEAVPSRVAIMVSSGSLSRECRLGESAGHSADGWGVMGGPARSTCRTLATHACQAAPQARTWPTGCRWRRCAWRGPLSWRR